MTSRDEDASVDGAFSPALYFSHSASMILFRVTDGLARSTTSTFNEKEAIDRKLSQRMKLGKGVERNRRLVEIKGLCNRETSDFRTRNKRVLKTVVSGKYIV